MNYDLLNEMIKYIEDNLDDSISYKKLAEIVGVSEYSLQRIFGFLTGISISEYIRKRRLSKAFEELKTTDTKIIDLAIKYGYDSSISFSRAFKKYFNMTPSECRNNKENYQLFPIIKFNSNKTYKDYKYEIKKIDAKELYCFVVKADTHDDLLFRIRQLYKKIRENKIRDKYDEVGMYGISICLDDKYEYYVGSEIKLPNTKKIIMDKGRYAVFKAGKAEQDDINNLYDFIYNEWLNSTNYKVLQKPELEFYKDNNCYIYIPIKDKQN